MYYLIDDVTIFSVDLGDGSEIPEDPKRLIELKPQKQESDSVAGRETTTNNNNSKLCVDHLRVRALIFIFVGHEEEEGIHT